MGLYSKTGQNQDSEPKRLFLFSARIRVLISMALTEFCGRSFMQLRNNWTSVYAWGNQTTEDADSEIKGMWGEKEGEKLAKSPANPE